jgi:hypothetical protein
MNKMNENNSTQSGGVDDGPRFMYGNRATYMKFARRMADSLGMSIEDWIMDMEKEFDIGAGRDVADTVSYFPTGDADAVNHGTNYHSDVSSEQAHTLWAARAERIAKIANLDIEVVDDIDADESKKEPIAEGVISEKRIGGYRLDKFELHKYNAFNDSPTPEFKGVKDYVPSGYRLYSGRISVTLDIHGDSLPISFDYGIGRNVPGNITRDELIKYQHVDANISNYIHNEDDLDHETLYRSIADFIVELYEEFPFGSITADWHSKAGQVWDNVLNVLQSILPSNKRDGNTLSISEGLSNNNVDDTATVDEELGTDDREEFDNEDILIPPDSERSGDGSEEEEHDFIPADEIEPEDGEDPTNLGDGFIPVEGGYVQYIRENLDDLGIDTLMTLWEDQLIEEHHTIKDEQIDSIIEGNLVHIIGEKSYKDLRRNAPHFLNIRGKSKDTPGSRFVNIDEKNICHFKTPSHTHAGVTYDQQVHLIDLEEIMKTQGGIKKPLEIIRLALEGNIAVHCTDPSWKFWGFQYIGTKEKYAITKEPRYPKVRNPRLKGSVCKHLDNVLFVLPFQNTKILRDLRRQKRL